jgi:uncharacterized protein YyaL (SSP411 family)
MGRYPSMVGYHLAVLHSFLTSRELAIIGPGWRAMSGAYWAQFRPNIALAPSETGSEPIPLFSGRVSESSETMAYVCEGQVCNLPTSDLAELSSQLG